MSVFSVSREGGWEFHPFLRAALVQWDELLHVAKCFCSRLWFSNPLHHIHFQCGFVLFLRFSGFITAFVVFIAWDLDFVNTAYATPASKIHTVVAIPSIAVYIR